MTTIAGPLVVESLTGPIPTDWAARSPFAGLDVCEQAGWETAPGSLRASFDEDVWDLTGVSFPQHTRESGKCVDFTSIVNPALRLTAKEYIFAVCSPSHERVLALPEARREPYKPQTAVNITRQLVQWMNFLTGQGLSSLSEVLQEHCDSYHEVRSERQAPGRGTGPLEPGSMLAILRPVVDLAVYHDLFTVDSYRAGFAPWQGRTVGEVAGWTTYSVASTPPVPDEVFQPTVAAALYLVETLGPLAVDEFERMVQANAQKRSATPKNITPKIQSALAEVLNRHVREKAPLVSINSRDVTKRLSVGWSRDDLLLAMNFRYLIREATNYSIVSRRHVEEIRPMLEAAVTRVGLAGGYGRNAARVPHHDDPQQMVPWTLPLTGDELRMLQFVLLAACRTLVAAISGMRASELDELTAASPQPAVTVPGGTKRFKLASKLVKGQDLGGVAEEWVVLEPAWRAVQLAARLNQAHGNQPVFTSASLDALHKRLREWVNGPDGQRLGLSPIPEGPVNGRMLRRTLALSLAYRPGGLLAAKIHLKHVTVVTTEGYAHRPGGSQGALLAEVEREQAEHHLKLTAEAFENFRAGRMPAGPGARDLIKAFEHIDAELKEHKPGSVSVLDSDRRLENLLRQQSKHLHLQTANYCWFRDPHKALCLKLAGTPDATKPLGGMCDSARCPQATHHTGHLSVWQSQVGTGRVFLDNPRFPKGEKKRFQPEVERAQRVVDEIMTAAGTPGEGK